MGDTLKEITESVARQKANGAPAERIVRRLIERGWPEASARQFVMNVHAERALYGEAGERRALARQGRLRALRGFVCILIGLVLIVVGLSLSDVFQGLYHFAIGILLCIFESIDFMSGVTVWWRNRG